MSGEVTGSDYNINLNLDGIAKVRAATKDVDSFNKSISNTGKIKSTDSHTELYNAKILGGIQDKYRKASEKSAASSAKVELKIAEQKAAAEQAIYNKLEQAKAKVGGYTQKSRVTDSLDKKLAAEKAAVAATFKHKTDEVKAEMSAQKQISHAVEQGAAARKKTITDEMKYTNLVETTKGNWKKKFVTQGVAGDVRGMKRALVELLGVGTMAGISASLLGGAGAAYFAKRQMAKGDEIEEGAQRMGTTTTGYQELGYAGKLAGLKNADFEAAYKKLATSIQKGDDPFRRLGLSAKEFAGMDPAKAIIKVVSAIQQIKDPAQRAAALVETLGKKGLGLNAIGNIEEKIKLGRKTGAIISEEDIARLASANDYLDQIAASVSGISASFIAGIIPEGAKWDKDLEHTGKTLSDIFKIVGGGLTGKWGMAGDDLRRMMDRTPKNETLENEGAKIQAEATSALARANSEYFDSLEKSIEILKNAEGPLETFDKNVETLTNAFLESASRGDNQMPMDKYFKGLEDLDKKLADSIAKETFSPVDQFNDKMKSLGEIMERVSDTVVDATRAESKYKDELRDKLGMSTLTEKYQQKSKEIAEATPDKMASKYGGGASSAYMGTQQDSGWQGRGPDPNELGTYAYKHVVGYNDPISGSYGRDTSKARKSGQLWENPITGRVKKFGSYGGYSDYEAQLGTRENPGTMGGGMQPSAPQLSDEQIYAQTKARDELKKSMGVESPLDEFNTKLYEMDQALKANVISQDEYNYGLQKNSDQMRDANQRIYDSTPQGKQDKLQFDANKTANDRLLDLNKDTMLDDMFSPARRSGGTFGNTRDAAGAVAMSRTQGQADWQAKALEIWRKLLEIEIDRQNQANPQYVRM